MNSLQRACSKIDIVIDLNSPEYSQKLEWLTNNNYNQELKKKGPRSKDVIRLHSSYGLGSELALHSTNEFDDSCEIVEDANSLKYEDRQKDLISKSTGLSVQVKSYNNKNKVWYISNSQYYSIKRSSQHNDVYIIMSYDVISSLKYKFKSKFLIDSNRIMKYIKSCRSKYSNYYFDHQEAINDGACIAL
jgi:hypothetical protein